MSPVQKVVFSTFLMVSFKAQKLIFKAQKLFILSPIYLFFLIAINFCSHVQETITKLKLLKIYPYISSKNLILCIVHTWTPNSELIFVYYVRKRPDIIFHMQIFSCDIPSVENLFLLCLTVLAPCKNQLVMNVRNYFCIPNSILLIYVSVLSRNALFLIMGEL